MDKAVSHYILVLDVNECAFAKVYRDKSFDILFEDKSYVPKKHKAGGQSAKRYQSNRQLAIITWFKKINERLMKYKDAEIHLGISPIYESQFMKYLHTYNKDKIVRSQSTEYTDACGSYQMVMGR